jgi:phage terminase Nu1 subunit (DNA packaging protein)
MARLTVTALAGRAGVHKSTVSRQARAWGMVGADGLIDEDAYLAARATGLDPALQTTGADAPAESSDLIAERTRKMAADAKLSELALARQSGELLDRAAVERATEDRARSLRNRLLMVPRAVAADLARLGEQRAIEARLTLALEGALAEEHDALRGAA